MTQAIKASGTAAPSHAQGAEGPAQYLTFHLGDEVYALDIRSVREIIQHCPMTSVPLMPQFVRGVINLRGAVVPVIDLRARFGRTTAEIGKKTCIVIFDCVRDGERMDLGLLVDSVSEVLEIAAESVEPPPNFGSSVRRDFIRGMGKLGSRFIVILEPEKAFDVDEMAGLCDSAQSARVN